MFNLVRIIIAILIYGTTGKLQCGFPGQPTNGIVNIVLDSSGAVAKYECPGSFIIDGDEERICRDDGTWTGTIPRCAIAATVRRSHGNEKVADGKLDTCNWIYGNSVVLEFAKKFHMYGIKIIYPAPYKGALQEAELDVQVLDGDRVTGSGVDRSFHERDPTFDNNDFLGVQWRLNGSGDAVRVIVNRGNVMTCEVVVYAFPEECGKIEEPRNGHVEYDKSSALCMCDTHYQVVGESSVRTCSEGRWSGEQCACRPRDIQGMSFVIILIGCLTLGFIPILLFLIFRSKKCPKCYSWLFCGMKRPQRLFMKTSGSSNAQCDELQKKMHNQIDPLLQPEANKEIFCNV